MPKIGDFELSDALAIYHAYRQKVVDEDTLINQRISWMLWSEAILFTIWAALAIPDRITETSRPWIGIALFCTSIVGALVAIMSTLSITAARHEMEDIKSKYKRAYKELYESDDRVPRLHSGKTTFRDGFIFATALPWIYFAVHFLAVIYVIYFYLYLRTIPGPHH